MATGDHRPAGRLSLPEDLKQLKEYVRACRWTASGLW